MPAAGADGGALFETEHVQYLPLWEHGWHANGFPEYGEVTYWHSGVGREKGEYKTKKVLIMEHTGRPMPSQLRKLGLMRAAQGGPNYDQQRKRQREAGDDWAQVHDHRKLKQDLDDSWSEWANRRGYSGPNRPLLMPGGYPERRAGDDQPRSAAVDEWSSRDWSAGTAKDEWSSRGWGAGTAKDEWQGSDWQGGDWQGGGSAAVDEWRSSGNHWQEDSNHWQEDSSRPRGSDWQELRDARWAGPAAQPPVAAAPAPPKAAQPHVAAAPAPPKAAALLAMPPGPIATAPALRFWKC